MIKEKLKSYDVMIIIILIFSGILLYNKTAGVDAYYIIKAGENALKYGLHTNDLLLMHKGLDYINQHWLTSIIYYEVDKIFGLKLGMNIITGIVSCMYLVAMYLLNRKVCKDNAKLAIMISFIEMFYLHYFNCLYNRQQVFSVVLLMIFILNLENYKDTANIKYLIYNVFISILEINLHMSIWWILIIAILPYIFNFKLKANKIEICLKENISYLIFSVIILITGLLNPYGFKGMTYIFRCGIDDISKAYCDEFWSILKANSDKQYLYYLILIGVLISIIYYIYKYKELEMEYIYFGIGGLLMSIIACRNICFTIIFSNICLGFLLRNYSIKIEIVKFVNIVSIIVIILVGFEYNTDNCAIKFNTPKKYIFENTIDMIDKYCDEYNTEKSNLKVYTGEDNLGAYIEYYGYHPFNDCRNETTRKEMNGVNDFYKESKYTLLGLSDCAELLEKYDIDVIYSTDKAIERMRNTNPEYFDNTWMLYKSKQTTAIPIVLYIRK